MTHRQQYLSHLMSMMHTAIGSEMANTLECQTVSKWPIQAGVIAIQNGSCYRSV